MSHIRTFLAIELAPPVIKKARKLIGKLAEIDSGVRWIDDQQMHITLQFLGDVDELDLAEVCSRVAAVAAEVPAFTIEVAGLGAFPNLHRPRTLWAGVTTGQEELRQLQQAIEADLNTMRFPREKRRYKPHLTLGRVRNDRGLEEVLAELNASIDYSFGANLVSEVIIFSSELTPSGPVYTRMGTAELG